jgi:hypothetical protein
VYSGCRLELVHVRIDLARLGPTTESESLIAP